MQDNLTDVWDVHGNRTQMSYDALGRKIAMDDPDMGHWEYEYDGAGNLIRQTDARGQVIRFRYDALNRLTAKDYGDDGTDDVRYYYDEPGHGYSVGQRTRMQDPSGSTAYHYEDARGRLTREVKHIEGAPQDYVTRYTYDDLDRVRTMTYPDGEVVTNTYDARGMLERVSSSWGGDITSGIAYNALGQEVLKRVGNGVETIYEYYTAQEGNNRLRSLCTGDHLLDLSYTYDRVGNIVGIEDRSSEDSSQWEALSFEYDHLDRLVRVRGAYQRNYEYDEIGNITGFNGVRYGYEGGKPHAVTHLDGRQRFWYDANGNMVLRVMGGVTQTLEYDAENRLVRVESGGGAVELVYDGDGRRVKKVEPWGETFYVGQEYEEFVPGQMGEMGTLLPALGLPTDYLFTGQKYDESTGLCTGGRPSAPTGHGTTTPRWGGLSARIALCLTPRTLRHLTGTAMY